jgi:copper chaperone CopZ
VLTAALESGIVDEAGAGVEAALTDATVDAYRAAMLAAVLIALVGALVAWRAIEDPSDRRGMREWLRGLRRRGDTQSAQPRGDHSRQRARNDRGIHSQRKREAPAPAPHARETRSGGHGLAGAGETQELRFRLRGMRCSGCERAVEAAVAAVAGVHQVAADCRTGEVTILVDRQTDPASLLASIKGAGYGISVNE